MKNNGQSQGGNTMKTTTSTVTPISENPKQPQPRQTAKEVIAANVKSLIEQLEAGHSDALTAYLDAMSRFHNYSFGNILEIARQRPDATRVAGMYAWNQLGRKVKKGERGIRILAPIVGVKRKKDEEAEKDITKQNTRVLVGFRNAYVFDVSQTEGAELPAMREMSGEVGENRARLISFISKQNIELVFTENIAPALGISYGGRIAILPGQSEAEEFSIHLALHGYVDSEFPDRSALVFAPQQQPTDDSLLQVREIRNLRLNANLVTLSACNTGVGPVGEEGVANIVNAFIEAGSQSVVSTLWELEDHATTHLMTVFYEHLGRHEEKAEALRQAQLEMLNSGSPPYYWAAFVLDGEPNGSLFETSDGNLTSRNTR
jgi:hypothetical protein